MPELRDTNYYADQVAARYPLLERKAVRRVCRYVLRMVSTLAVDGQDVLLQSARYALTLKVFALDNDVARHNRENAGRRATIARLREKRARWLGSGSRTNASQFALKIIK